MKCKLLLVVILGWGLCAHAQAWRKNVGKLISSRPKTSATLHTLPKASIKESAQFFRQVTLSCQQARLLQAQLFQRNALSVLRMPYADTRLTTPLDMALLDVLYPHMRGRIKTKRQLTDYFIIQNNRQILQQAQEESARLIRLQQSIDHLKSNQIQSGNIRHQEMQWLAEKISTDIDYLLLGEVHEVPEIHQHFALLARELRTKFGDRPIIWLTEFLPESLSNFSDELRDQMLPSLVRLWDALQAENIPVVGLENLHVIIEDASLKQSQEISIWETYEGVRQRNQLWGKKIAKIRKENPRALIILHSGFGHLDYTRPYSLGTFLRQQERIFNVSFAPGYKPDYLTELNEILQEDAEWAPLPCPPQGFAPVSYFDFMTRGHFPQQVLEFGPQDWYLTGFDIQIKIPATPDEKKPLEEE